MVRAEFEKVVALKKIIGDHKRAILISSGIISLPFLLFIYLWVFATFDPVTCGGTYMTAECLLENPDNMRDSDFIQQNEKMIFMMSLLQKEICNPELAAKILDLRDDVANCAHCREQYIESQQEIAKKEPQCYLSAVGKVTNGKSEIRYDMNVGDNNWGPSVCTTLASFQSHESLGSVYSAYCD